LNHEWESEGFDRPTLSMPGQQDELIEVVAKANKNTVVVIQAVSDLVFIVVVVLIVCIGICCRYALGGQGRWWVSLIQDLDICSLSRTAGVLQGWYLGNEAGNAIGDVLFGKVNPSGRLPISLPRREEDIPAHLSFGSEMGKVHYREDVFVGYKHYQARNVEPLFPFGWVAKECNSRRF
jgi:beta-glucosidase